MGPAMGEVTSGAAGHASPPTGGTRQRIQAVALELFAEQGYEKTSLREIAERLGVTKAALYYHFKSKEDIVRSFTEDYRSELDDVLEWAASQPATAAGRAEILDRYTGIVSRSIGVIRFIEQNQAALHGLMAEGGDRKKLFRDQFRGLCDVLAPPGAPLEDRMRATMAVVSIGMGSMLFQEEAASPEELHTALLNVAGGLVGTIPPGQPVAATATRGSTR